MPWRRTASLALTIVLTAASGAGESDAAPEEPASVAPGPALEPTPLAGAVVDDDTNLPAERWADDPYQNRPTAPRHMCRAGGRSPPSRGGWSGPRDVDHADRDQARFL